MLALSRLPDEARFAALSALEDHEVARLAHTWEGWARDDQLPPATTASGTPWRTWLVLGGRGAGKTRTGAEWVRARALGPPYSLHRARRIALVGETLGQVRSVMIEGLSGLLSIHPEDERPRLEISRSQLVWPNGAMAQMFAADDPDSLRGPQFDAAWCDELCKWRVPEKAWDMLQFALRLGPLPQCVVTTTPRPIALLTAIKGDEATVTSRSRTVDNVANLAPAFLAEMQRRYADTPLGRQELDGEIVEDRLGRPRRCRGPGAANNPNVVRYYADAGHPEVRADEVAWCAAFVGACLERAGVGSTRSLMARSYLAWGQALDEPRTGAIAVLSRGADPSLGHVGFLVGLTASDIVLLAGNQGDAVSVQAFPRSRRRRRALALERGRARRSTRHPGRRVSADPGSSPTPSSSARSPTCSRWRAATTRTPTIPAAPPTSASRSPSSCATRAWSSPPTTSPP